MRNYTQIRKLFRSAQVIRSPKHRLSTFGSSNIDYTLITDIPGLPDRTRLRTGHVTTEQPSIITAQTIKNQFSGFGLGSNATSDWLLSQYGEALQGLEYQFRNVTSSTRIELKPPEQLTRDLTQRFDRESQFRTALLRGSDKLWQISVMKFIVEETLASFSSNVQELKDRGFFDGEMKDIRRQNREVQYLLSRAKHDPSLVADLGRKLKAYGLFDQYQDEFFGLLKR